MKHFNPRTREGCDIEPIKNSHYQARISIHAPVKGATIERNEADIKTLIISIHAPVKGATYDIDGSLYRIRQISIHAPVKGATTPPYVVTSGNK